MHYSYKSNGIVSRSIGDYRDSVISDFASFQVWEGAQEFTEGQYQTVELRTLIMEPLELTVHKELVVEQKEVELVLIHR